MMQEVTLRAYVFVVAGLRSKLADERGEIGSWLILAAGLAIAAAAAVAALTPWLAGKVGDVTSS